MVDGRLTQFVTYCVGRKERWKGRDDEEEGISSY
jgi:hypothetical protein